MSDETQNSNQTAAPVSRGVVSDLFFCAPLPASSNFHVFRDGNNRSLCGKYGLLTVVEGRTTRLTGQETYKKGYDCKACFRKAGLSVDR